MMHIKHIQLCQLSDRSDDFHEEFCPLLAIKKPFTDQREMRGHIYKEIVSEINNETSPLHVSDKL